MKKLFLSRFIIVSMLVGVFSPNVDIVFANGKSQVDISIFHKADAKVKRHKHKPPHSKPPHHKPSNHYYYTPYYKHHHHHHGYYHGRQILAFTAGLAIGSIIASSTMPTTCISVMVDGITYRKCGNTYYKPFYHGNTLVYEVVRSPY